MHSYTDSRINNTTYVTLWLIHNLPCCHWQYLCHTQTQDFLIIMQYIDLSEWKHESLLDNFWMEINIHVESSKLIQFKLTWTEIY